jgi:hypothetical protein
MATIVKPTCIAAVLLVLGACSKLGGMGQDDMKWARAALDRNDHIQVVASDPQARTFTVRLKESGELRVVTIDQLVAGPPLIAGVDTPSKPAAGAGAPEAPAETSEGPSSAMTAAAPSQAAPAQPAPSQPMSQPAPSQAASGDQAAPESAESSVAQVEKPHADSAANAKVGSVLASGPGYSIKASGPKGGATRASPLTASRGTPVERLHDPIICQGSRLLHIDNRNLEFDGDAVSAEDGCEIHITNTHISAKGIGVLARAANVHIENSEIEGDSGAIDASDGAQVYAESSRFRGLTRRLESSAFHDLGGNVWN